VCFNFFFCAISIKVDALRQKLAMEEASKKSLKSQLEKSHAELKKRVSVLYVFYMPCFFFFFLQFLHFLLFMIK
jgi:hypothetical protein